MSNTPANKTQFALITCICVGYGLVHLTAVLPLKITFLTDIRSDLVSTTRTVLYGSEIAGAIVTFMLTYVLPPARPGTTLLNRDILVYVSIFCTGFWYIIQEFNASLNRSCLFVLAGLVGWGHGSLFVSIATIIQNMVDPVHRAASVAIFCGAQGSSYIISGLEILFISDRLTDLIPYTSLNISNLIMYFIGLTITMVGCTLRKRFLEPYALSGNNCKMGLSLKARIAALSLVIFLGYSNVVVYQTYTRCCFKIFQSHWAQSTVSFGVFYLALCIYTICTVREWDTGLNPIMVCIFFSFGFGMMGVTFWGKCDGDDSSYETPYYWSFIPMTGAFLGAGSASLFIEVMTLLSTVYPAPGIHYSLIIVAEGAWGILHLIHPGLFTLHFFLIFTSVFIVIYVVCIPVIYGDVDRRLAEMVTLQMQKVMAQYQSIRDSGLSA